MNKSSITAKLIQKYCNKLSLKGLKQYRNGKNQKRKYSKKRMNIYHKITILPWASRTGILLKTSITAAMIEIYLILLNIPF